ncbi:MAG: hypothetical protein LBF42_03610 [Puniceicoccales bacterium]|nr:hypothetical protein [Puniceicoccales bacterium]
MSKSIFVRWGCFVEFIEEQGCFWQEIERNVRICIDKSENFANIEFQL